MSPTSELQERAVEAQGSNTLILRVLELKGGYMSAYGAVLNECSAILVQPVGGLPKVHLLLTAVCSRAIVQLFN